MPSSATFGHQGAPSGTLVHSGQQSAHIFWSSCPKQPHHLARQSSSVRPLIRNLEPEWNLPTMTSSTHPNWQVGYRGHDAHTRCHPHIATFMPSITCHHQDVFQLSSKGLGRHNNGSIPNVSYIQQGDSLMLHRQTLEHIKLTQRASQHHLQIMDQNILSVIGAVK
jgi:hypothetical protein